MTKTLNLLARAVRGQTNEALARKLGAYSSACAKAHERGRLPPILAGQVAEQPGRTLHSGWRLLPFKLSDQAKRALGYCAPFAEFKA